MNYEPESTGKLLTIDFILMSQCCSAAVIPSVLYCAMLCTHYRHPLTLHFICYDLLFFLPC